MIIHIRIENNRCRYWLAHLSAALAKIPGSDVRLDLIEGDARPSSALDFLLKAEKLLLRKGRDCGADLCPASELSLPPASFTTPDVVIDLTNAPPASPLGGENPGAPDAIQILRPLYNSVAGEEALAGFLIQQQRPCITIAAEGRAEQIAKGFASLEAVKGIGSAMETIYSRVVMLLTRVLSGIEETYEPMPPVTPAPVSYPDAISHLARGLCTSALHAIYERTFYRSHWRIGWRFVDGDGVFHKGDLSGPRWNVLPHPIDHFYADPFVFESDGKAYLFFEDFDHRLGKGVISVVPFGEDGPLESARTVLEEDWHLSYPFVFEHDGDAWMIPESSTNREVVLYRAVDFPYRWERHTALLSDIEAADATVIHFKDRWWLFTVTRDGLGGYSDTLCLYTAKDLFGPWSAHAKNPVLIDDKGARPAGRMVIEDGKLWRPTQNCSGTYGAAVELACVTRLDDDAFEQVVHVSLHPGGPDWPGRKFHTLNRVGRLEVIDGSIFRPKIRFAALLTDRFYRPG
ncbi:MAG: hypothetical protein H2045_05315 [Rhizobiales bacterium]|nr:hypothetical protein [Hyphomicrobiales bacterium]